MRWQEHLLTSKLRVTLRANSTAAAGEFKLCVLFSVRYAMYRLQYTAVAA